MILIDELLDKGAYVNAVNYYGDTALMIAAQNGHTEIVAKLLVQGADVKVANSDAYTAFMIAVLKPHRNR